MSILRTDLYTLTMADAFVRHGRDDLVSFELMIRGLPDDAPWAMLAGVVETVEALEQLAMSEGERAWLAADGRFSGALLDRLGHLRFTGTVWAMPEGTCVPAGVPVLRVTAPRVEAALIEPVVLACVNYGTRIATVAARVVTAAAGRAVYDFSLRRVDGPAAGLEAARAAWVGGLAGTALPEAGLRYGIPTVGTMAHHAVMLHGEAREQKAFEEALVDHPEGTALLVDTYDTERGVARAIAAAKATGVPLHGVRVDSGDLAAGARRTREQLDAAGLRDTEIMLSGDLDAPRIAAMVRDGVPVDSFAIGTRLRSGEPLGGVYKLCAQHDVPDPGLRAVMKLSPDKTTDPGVHQVTRTAPGEHLVHLAHEAVPGTPLLRPVLVRGTRIPGALDLDAARAHAEAEREERDASAGPLPPPRRSPALEALRDRLSGPVAFGARDALLVVDVQHDFLPGGALGVPDGDRVLEPIAGLLRAARRAGAPVFASRDRHPVGHVSFADRGGPWPPHCVEGTRGAQLHPDLDLDGDGVDVLDKGTDLDVDAYSAFDGTDLARRLARRGVRRVLVCGLATDYCVRATALDALDAGLATLVVTDAVAAVDVTPGDGARALDELRSRGASTAPGPKAA